VTALLFTLAIIAAVIAMALRRRRRTRLRRAAATRPGASADLAIAIRSFSEIDDQLAGRWCHCGGYLERMGEGTREAGGRRYRIARLRCQECDETAEVYFETSEVMH
jgi:hypothetical protein